MEQLVVRVDEVNSEGAALCSDTYGQTHLIPTSARRGKGGLPRPGEYWVIDRAFGDWTFAAVLDAALPEVGGDVEDGSAADNLLTALTEAGLIRDKATRVPPGGDGGSTGVDWTPWMNVHP